MMPLTAPAASYSPSFRLLPDGKAEVVKGGIVYLFHSETRDIIDTFRIGDIFIVYRINSSCEMEKIGMVKFLKIVGEIYIEAEVIEGDLKAGDIARRNNLSCLVVATEPCNR